MAGADCTNDHHRFIFFVTPPPYSHSLTFVHSYVHPYLIRTFSPPRHGR